MESNINPKLKKGDRIVLYYMKDESLSPGTKGTVTGTRVDPFSQSGIMITVEWDNGSTLSLMPEEDIWKKIR